MSKLITTLVLGLAIVSAGVVIYPKLNLASLIKPATTYVEPIKNQEVETKSEINALLKRMPEDLWRISYCETGIRHVDESGRTLPGAKDPDDRGLLQINRRYHLSGAKRLGYDIETLRGNVLYGMSLYSSRGAVPWKWSYDPKNDQCVNNLKLPPRDSRAWKEIKKNRLSALIASAQEAGSTRPYTWIK